MSRLLLVVFAVGALFTAAPLACNHNASSPASDAGPSAGFSRDVLLDPQTCGNCHKAHYADWTASMHAYASDDPVFIAMNQRGQKETDGGLGDFCVKCHAPMAVRDGMTTDGLNLADLPPKYKGVTCFFCHSVASVDGTHNAALSLSDDLVMRGEVSDPLPNAAHSSAYSPLHDLHTLDSAKMCGTCHDIVVAQTNTPIERTFCEWSHSAFSADPQGQGGRTCADCHMYASNGPIAQVSNAPIRRYHAHDFPGVDVALGPSLGDAGVEQATAQQFLASSLQGALCVTQAGGIRVIVDPFSMGHDWPSGAAQDRRAWAEVVATSGGNVIYQSGVVPDGSDVVASQANDPDLWLLRDQIFDTQGNPVHMFWQAAKTQGNELHALTAFDPMAPGYTVTHVVQLYPRGTAAAPATLPQMPDRVTLRFRLQPIGLDVLNDLVNSGYLDPSVASNMPTYDVSFLAADGSVQAMLEWTSQTDIPASGKYPDPYDNTLASCVTTNGFNVGADKLRAPDASAPLDCSETDAGGASTGSADGSSDAGAEGDADAAAQCDNRYKLETVAPGLVVPGVSGALSFEIVSADPAPPGQNWNTWVVRVRDKGGNPVTDATFPTIKTFMPEHNHPGSIVPTWTSNGDGTYAIKLYLVMPGVWQVTPTAQAGSTTDSATFTFCVGG